MIISVGNECRRAKKKIKQTIFQTTINTHRLEMDGANERRARSHCCRKIFFFGNGTTHYYYLNTRAHSGFSVFFYRTATTRMFTVYFNLSTWQTMTEKKEFFPFRINCMRFMNLTLPLSACGVYASVLVFNNFLSLLFFWPGVLLFSACLRHHR